MIRFILLLFLLAGLVWFANTSGWLVVKTGQDACPNRQGVLKVSGDFFGVTQVSLCPLLKD